LKRLRDVSEAGAATLQTSRQFDVGKAHGEWVWYTAAEDEFDPREVAAAISRASDSVVKVNPNHTH
jgi:hypothetical protein